MPGTQVVNKQNTLGGAAGIALLAFALIYRFFPDLVHFNPQATTRSVELPTLPSVRVEPIAGETAPVNALEPPPMVEVPATQMGPPAPPKESTKAIAALLKKADLALTEGRLLGAHDNSAEALFRQALQADAGNATAREGLSRIRASLEEQAQAALDRGDETESVHQIAALEGFVSQASELDLYRARLKILKQVTPLLAHAADLLKVGKSGSDNGAALEAYRQVLVLDPANRLADQGLAQIERGFLDRALAAAAQDDFGGADSILAAATSLRPGSHDLLDTRSRIEGLRRGRATSLLEQARSALDAGNPDLGEQLAQRALAMSPDVTGVDDFREKIKNARLYASLTPGQVIRDNFLDRSGSAPEMVVVPAGSFSMGSPENENGHRSSEEPQRDVRIGIGFALGRSEVSVAEFRDFVRASDYVSDAQKSGGSIVYDEGSGRIVQASGIDWQFDYHGERANDNLPVIHISWNDANEYARWLAARTGKRYRLVSEAEFEYALRAGSKERYWWGDGNPNKVLANLTGDGDRSPSQRSWSKAFVHYRDGYWGPAPVRSFAANPLGIFDLDGNVSEWTEDCWHENYTRAPHDSRAWINPGCEQHVVRGGSWGSAPEQVRSAFRSPAPADTRSARVGMRVARDL
jgi:formylglycine-generating enzyme required for sulfatase activity